MRLLVKRDTSTKGGVFGSKQLFQMTLKLELSPEEQAVIERYGLQPEFKIDHPSNSKSNLTFPELMSGKTLSHTSPNILVAELDMYTAALANANTTVKHHLLFPGESVIEIA
jgi:hypothetical protein